MAAAVQPFDMPDSPATDSRAPQRPRPAPFAWQIGGGLGAGALLAACFPPYNVPYLLPVAMAALLYVLRDAEVRQAAYIGLACGAVYFGGTLFWFVNLFGPAAVPLIGIEVAFVVMFAVLHAWLRKRLPRVPVWLLAPVAWTAVEYFRSELFFLNFGWMGLGYAVVNYPLLVTVASWFGSYGITFAVVLLGAIMVSRTFSRMWFIWRFVGLSCLWTIICFLIPRAAPTPSRPLNVRLVQAEHGDQRRFDLSRPVPGQSTDVILWPEFSVPANPEKFPQLWNRLQDVARDNRCHFIFGTKDRFDPRDPKKFYNTAYVLAADGRLIGRHNKNHPVHFFNDGVAATEARAIPTALGRLGVAICFDMDFPDVARRLVQDGAEALLVPNMDPIHWGRVQRAQHGLMSQMRAVECGRWVARADVAGGTSAVDPTGREVGSVRTANPAKLEVRIGRETHRTLYVRGGWRFSQVCLAALIMLFIWALVPARFRPGS